MLVGLADFRASQKVLIIKLNGIKPSEYAWLKHLADIVSRITINVDVRAGNFELWITYWICLSFPSHTIVKRTIPRKYDTKTVSPSKLGVTALCLRSDLGRRACSVQSRKANCILWLQVFSEKGKQANFSLFFCFVGIFSCEFWRMALLESTRMQLKFSATKLLHGKD